jgi:hypothetical protein
MPDGVEIIRGGKGGARTGGTVGREKDLRREALGFPALQATGWKPGPPKKRCPSGAWAEIGVPKQVLGNEGKKSPLPPFTKGG